MLVPVMLFTHRLRFNRIWLLMSIMIAVFSVTGPLKASLNENLDKWDATKSLLQNIQDTLNVTLPSSKTSKKEVRVL